MPTFRAADGTELAYHLRGEGAPLACLPGGPMRATTYLGDLGGLSSRRQLIMLDLRGTGESAIPADPATYRCDRVVDDVRALQDHLGLEASRKSLPWSTACAATWARPGRRLDFRYGWSARHNRGQARRAGGDPLLCR